MKQTKYIREKHHCWKDGRRTSRKIALSEYPLKCMDCGSTGRLHVHHEDQNTHNNRLDNLVVLCPSCHLKRHRKKPIIKCEICKQKKVNYAKGLCEECYKEKWEQENKERHLQTARDWKRINRPYINDYKKWRRGTLKEKPKLKDYTGV